jgi:predicted peptidase
MVALARTARPRGGSRWAFAIACPTLRLLHLMVALSDKRSQHIGRKIDPRPVMGQTEDHPVHLPPFRETSAMRRLIHYTSLLLVFAGMTLPLQQTFAADFDAYEKHVFEHDGGKLNYRMMPPAKIEAGQKYPLVLFLHGAGERGNDNEAQLRHGAGDFASEALRSKYPAFVVAPQCPSEEKWVDAPWSGTSHDMPSKPSDSLGLTMALVEKMIEEKPIDTNRIYVTGLSMGGFGTWDLMARWPDRIAAAIPVCGGADTQTAERIKHIPVWVFHGDQDTAVKPQRSQDMVAALKDAGGSPKYTEYEGVGHDSWSRTYSNPEVYQWLFDQQLKK